ncbi:unnamed protein product, partial [Rotaria magnacalcarata]
VSTTREQEVLANEIENIILGFSKEENNAIIDAEDDSGYIEFKHYNELREKRYNLEAEQSLYFLEHYQEKSNEYMDKTEAYECLGVNDSLPNLIERTNKYLEVRLARLYYLPKTHKPGAPPRPIVSGLKHPTIKISKYLDELLAPLFDKMALNTTLSFGFGVIKNLYEWPAHNLRQETLLCTIDVVDLYTMIPKIEGVLAIRKMLDCLKIKPIGGLKIETIIRLIHDGAMGSPLTITITNFYMFFFERDIIKQIINGGCYGINDMP